MFTGIIQDIAKIIRIRKFDNFIKWVLQFDKISTKTLLLGSSISCNGCCLTINEIENNTVSVDLVQETLKLTNFINFVENQEINIERSVKFGGEIGGHLVSGHVMTTAKISKIVVSNYNKEIWVKLDNFFFMKYIFYKGFICIDGISLTVGNINKNVFCVSLIPETLSHTTIGKKRLGDFVNIEIDYLTKVIVDSTNRLISNI
ncbi:riboflavin synthase subunit alpha [Buchnera aphidicola (Schlechtendalia chinensis)]|uniref:Riboflavin synthase n=1 Tax=Buchnera aphidicola subsp. Schlechtendalia chinensis TaxID=118110 RepID=A0A172WD78_BUCSC|nr:riboflavin synthase subunit alpha [Buchnera aphidicola]ANF16919.1 riboflavin synthase subunit alpha [Buchnera aphidicola (Schlechtendalia chinensis)]